jgi:hypothetical protein
MLWEGVLGEYVSTNVGVPNAGGVVTLSTRNNVAWTISNTSPIQWINCGPWSGGPGPRPPNTWWGGKGKYEGNK